MVDFGADLDDSFELDPETGDFKTVEGLENAKQAIKNRIMTKYNELLELGYTDYGNKSWLVLGETDIELAKAHVEIYTENCLATDPMVHDLVNIETSHEKGVITVRMNLLLVSGDFVDIEGVFKKDAW